MEKPLAKVKQKLAENFASSSPLPRYTSWEDEKKIFLVYSLFKLKGKQASSVNYALVWANNV